MAIRIEQRRALNAVEIVSELDDAIDKEASDLAGYQETADISKLKFLPGMTPTVFLCNFSLKGKEPAHIKNSMVGGVDDDGRPSITMGTWSFKVVKYTLKDIKNPEGIAEDQKLVYKKDQNGYAHDDVLATLDQLGILNEIFGFYSRLVMVGPKANAKN